MTKILLPALIAFGMTGLTPYALADQPTPAKEVVVGISDAHIPSGFDRSSDAYVVANGMYPNGCYKFSRSDVVHQPGLVHEVRIYAAVQQGMCLMVLVPFTKEVVLGKLETGLHKIRFMGGDGTYLEKTLEIK